MRPETETSGRRQDLTINIGMKITLNMTAWIIVVKCAALWVSSQYSCAQALFCMPAPADIL